MEDDSDENSDDEDEQENEDEDDSDDDESVSPAQVRGAASLLATMKQSEDDNADGALLTDDDGAPRLLAAHCCHGCFPAATIADVVNLAEAHVAEHGWLTKRHSQHPTTDFSLLDAPLVLAAAMPLVSSVVLPTLHSLYFGGANAGAISLEVNDLFYVRYDGSTAGAQRELEAHRDGSLLSFSIALTDPSSFEGGGTRFMGVGRVMR